MTNSRTQSRDDPAISCVIPVHNGKRDLDRAVTSVLAQRPDVQVILVDDASTDGSTALVLELARIDPRIDSLLLPSNRGQGYARNVGVAAAQSPYITFLDQDDEYLRGWYDFAVAALEKNPGYAAVKGDIELVDIPAGVSITRGDTRWNAMVNSVIWNVVMHKVIYGVLGGCPTSMEFRTREGNEDIKLMMQLVQHCHYATTGFLAARHYIQPNGATAMFLKRTPVENNGAEFADESGAEQTGGATYSQIMAATDAATKLQLLHGMVRARSD